MPFFSFDSASSRLHAATLTLALIITSSFFLSEGNSAGPAQAAKKWAQFDLVDSEPDGTVQPGKDLVLTVTLGGVPAGTESVMAIIESPGFQTQTVSLSENESPTLYQGTAILEPNSALKSRTTVVPKAVRVRVTFGHAKTTGLEEYLKRDVYVTLGDRPPEEEEDDPAANGESEISEPDNPAAQKAMEHVLTVNATIPEEDLLPLPAPGEAKAYWKQVSDLISRNWARHVRAIRRAPSGEVVRVKFRMYASGVAQLIQIEKGSGARDINEAGLQAVIQAHPFPPVPPDMGDEAVEVHVRMRTGAKVAAQDVQTTVEKKPQKASGAAARPADKTAADKGVPEKTLSEKASSDKVQPENKTSSEKGSSEKASMEKAPADKLPVEKPAMDKAPADSGTTKESP
jgi:TonB family protein